MTRITENLGMEDGPLFLRTPTQILHDLSYQNPRKHGSTVYKRSCRVLCHQQSKMSLESGLAFSQEDEQ